jgi:alkanesulfonate monooxygenase SsuD/methylene tetrahydromethanopterin reductase-like flavin-dependent oxidoreductase (luciferase family)
VPEHEPKPGTPTGVTVGLLPPTSWLRDGAAERAAWLSEVSAAGIDHVAVGDHVSFLVGAGSDGLIDAATLLSSHPTLAVHTAAYLLPLRHPVLVARQLATIAELAPGRLTFGVGVGGEDRHEIEVCGVDPARRGRRMDQSLVALRDQLARRATTTTGPEFEIRDALVLPAPDPPVPFLIAGRSRAATRRAGRLGDGWLGLWVSARRFADAVAEVAEDAEAAGRDPSTFRHSLNVWCSFDDDPSSARRLLEDAMGSLYHLPLERFERWSPFGSPGEVVAFLAPYVEAGCSTFNLIAQGRSRRSIIDGVAEVRVALGGR